MISLGPSTFYGTSLPRPRIYTDFMFNDHRVDPPAPVSDPLMSWAEEAHWSMGGLNYKRLRLQGKIEGNVQKLRSQREKAQSQSPSSSPIPSAHSGSKRDASPTPPPAPFATKRRRCVDLIEVEVCEGRKSRLVKKLGDDFDRVASLENERSDTILLKTPNRKLVNGGETVKRTVAVAAEKPNPKAKKSSSEGEKVRRVRTSPRFTKRVSN